MTDYTFASGLGLTQKATTVRNCGEGDGLTDAARARCGCGCGSVIYCPSMIVGPAGPQGEQGPAGPQGAQGPAGPAGETPTFTVGTVTVGPDPAVTITGEAPDYVLNFVLPEPPVPVE